MTIDDFEWEMYAFDTWYLMHKTYHHAIARVNHFNNGWHIVINDVSKTGDSLVVDSLDAAKVIAAISAAPHIKRMPNVKSLRKRFIYSPSGPVRRGVFKVG